MSNAAEEPTIDLLFDKLWRSYVEITPQAEAVHALLRERGDSIDNDHVALRTFGVPAIGLESMARVFTELGFEERDSYVFEVKKLRACYYYREGLPKVFISELDMEAMPADVRAVIDSLLAQIPPGFTDDPAWLAAGRPWILSRSDYQLLADHSDYASWVAVHGFRANHFTVDVDSLQSVASIGELTEVLSRAGFVLNDSGGVIKGSPDVLLEQASTRADQLDVELEGGPLVVPTCYVEFAKRYRAADGTLYQGFVASSADKIFESTTRE
ncbi:MAG: DUF1338 domain-containing protein [Deltaproteobacteria bacterium]|nr:DUF1338 domain-containing protein [Deltaproteobacteria bacterium]